MTPCRCSPTRWEITAGARGEFVIVFDYEIQDSRILSVQSDLFFNWLYGYVTHVAIGIEHERATVMTISILLSATKDF